jgi:hypothetical protein
VTFLRVCLALQALLLCFRLDLLDLWTDELFTLQTVMLPVPQILRTVQGDIHPPLYYLLQHFWLHVPLPLSPIVQLRLLSVAFALAATVALDKLWGPRLPARWRPWLVALWAASPCVVLYGRMARSYSLQVLVVLIAVYWGARFLADPSRRNLLWFAAGLSLSFYTHYVPGLALAGAAAGALLWRRRAVDRVKLGALVLIAYLPWVWVMAESIGKWASSGSPYALTGGAVTELALKAAFATVSFGLGESLPAWALALGLLLLPAALWLLWTGVRRERDIAHWVAAMGAVGFLGVAGWVSYPFLPARLLFLLPFLLLLVATGCAERPRVGRPFAIAMLALWAVGLWGYFHKSDYLNKGYAIPFAEIAARIEADEPADESLVLCDTLNTDSAVLRYYLDPKRRMQWIGGADTPQVAAQAIADPAVRAVWLVRNQHDISPDGVNSQAEAELAHAFRAEPHPYLPLSGFEQRLARAVAGHDPPRYFYTVTRFRR